MSTFKPPGAQPRTEGLPAPLEPVTDVFDGGGPRRFSSKFFLVRMDAAARWGRTKLALIFNFKVQRDSIKHDQ